MTTLVFCPEQRWSLCCFSVCVHCVCRADLEVAEGTKKFRLKDLAHLLLNLGSDRHVPAQATVIISYHWNKRSPFNWGVFCEHEQRRFPRQRNSSIYKSVAGGMCWTRPRRLDNIRLFHPPRTNNVPSLLLCNGSCHSSNIWVFLFCCCFFVCHDEYLWIKTQQYEPV